MADKVCVSSEAINRTLDLRLSAAEWSLYMYLTSLGDRDKLPPVSEINNRLGIGKSTFYKSIARLQAEGLLPEWIKSRSKCSGYVYLIQAEGTTKYKIGKAENIKTRLTTLQHQSPFMVKLIHSIESDQPFKTESILHKQYQSCRSHGEWFDLTQEQVEEIKQISFIWEGLPVQEVKAKSP